MDINILAVGRNAAILKVVERLINSHEGWHATIATTEQEAINAFKAKPYAIILVSSGFSVQEEENLRQQLTQLDSGVFVTRHFGGGSGLLENEILNILENKQQ